VGAGSCPKKDISGHTHLPWLKLAEFFERVDEAMWCYFPETCNVHSRHHERLKSHFQPWLFLGCVTVFLKVFPTFRRIEPRKCHTASCTRILQSTCAVTISDAANR
jgi:hypothetical protein